MFLNTVGLAFLYVIGDIYFWPSMTLTTLTGIFIGSVTYDGDIKQIKKALVLLFSYSTMIFLVTFTRVIKDVAIGHKPFAGLVTIFLVTIFYLLGMYWGVKVIKGAHDIR